MVTGGAPLRGRALGLAVVALGCLPLLVRSAIQPDYEFDLRNCDASGAIASTGSDTSVSATPGGDPSCSADGMGACVPSRCCSGGGGGVASPSCPPPNRPRLLRVRPWRALPLTPLSPLSSPLP